ncbi:AAA family ATPase [Bosea sp. (in: a-proteobacteria)]|uniref:AAA family ATPase n=1 Tax=Bosea sp. (in: a-proteobacteria) TaxID=1871050 RepID=UPI003B3AA9DA
MTNTAEGPSETPISARELEAREFAPLEFIVQGLIPMGLTVLAGAPKARKSWLALDIALSVARGTACLDERKNHCPQGAVLYLALEDSERRLKDRIGQILAQMPHWPADLFFETQWPRMDADGLVRLRHWIDMTPQARLIVIDVFQKFRSASGAQASYAKEYADLTELLNLAREKHVGIVLIHHLRKSKGDPFERMTGSTGFLGVPDTLIVLDTGRGTSRLLAQGRDIHETAMEIIFDEFAMRWRLAQPRVDANKHPERDRISAVLEAAAGPLSPMEIAAATGQGRDAVRQLLKSMVDSGEIENVGRGLYVSRKTAAAGSSSGDHSDHNGHDHNDRKAREARLVTERECDLREEAERASFNDPGPASSGESATLRYLYDALDRTMHRIAAAKKSGDTAA